MRLVALACTLFACGDNEILIPPTGKTHAFVVTRQQSYGSIKLTTGRSIGNVLGNTLELLAQRGIDPWKDNDRLINRGDFIQLVHVQYPTYTGPDNLVALRLFEGTAPSPSPCRDELDTRCGRHLQGDATFVVWPTSRALMLGERNEEGHALLGPAPVFVAVGFFGEVLRFDLVGAHAIVGAYAPTDYVTIAGGVRRSIVENEMAPRVLDAMNSLITQECTRTPVGYNPCGCPDTSKEYEAYYWVGMFDRPPNDCVVTVEELLNAPITSSFLHYDIQVDGEELVSFALGMTLVPARFEP